MLLATVSLSTATHLVGLVGPYKQPYRKTLSLNRARYKEDHISLKMAAVLFTGEFSRWQYLTLGRKDYLLKEEALRNTRQVKRWNLELLERRKHLSRTNSRFVKAKDNLPSQEIFRAADFLGNAQALLRVYGRVNYTFDCKFLPK